jgi:hypothetical protein
MERNEAHAVLRCAAGRHGDTRFTAALASLIVCTLAWFPARAHAESPPQSTSSMPAAARPWAAGVSESEQAIALDLFAAGNREFTESRFPQALAKYKEAIQHWDHPAIRYNMAVCLIMIDQPVDARDNIQRSLAYGAAALGPNAHGQALTYRKLLDAQLGHLKIECQEPGAQVTLDGKLLFTGPGMAETFLIAGEHQVVATKAGLLTASKTLVVVAGKLSTYNIKPLTPPGPRWWHWKPLLATGVVVAGFGVAFHASSSRNFTAFDERFRQLPCAAAGCPDLDVPPGLSNQLGRARQQQQIAVGSYIVGGSLIVGAIVLLYLNQRPIERTADRSPTARITVAPTVSADMFGILVSASH